MTLTPEQEHKIKIIAARQQKPAEAVLNEWLAGQMEEHPDAILQRRAIQRVKNQAAIDLLDKWRAEDTTDDPEELERLNREYMEFKAAMNQNRADTGEEPVYCD